MNINDELGYQLLRGQDRQALQTYVQTLHDQHGQRIMSVVLFGSKCRGDADLDSDIDVLVRLADDDWQLGWVVRLLAARVSLEHNVLLSVRAIGPDQWARMERYQVPLYQAIQAEGLDLTSMHAMA